MNEKPASEQIDDIIKQYGGWKGATIARLRSVITKSDSSIKEDINIKILGITFVNYIDN